jgi:hypothetical protein
VDGSKKVEKESDDKEEWVLFSGWERWNQMCGDEVKCTWKAWGL